MTRNELKLFKETTWVTNLAYPNCKSNAMQYYTILLHHILLHLQLYSMGSFPLVRQVHHWQRQPAVNLYYRWCIMRSGVGVLARKIKFTMTVMVEPQITYFSFNHWIKFFSFKKYFSFLNLVAKWLWLNNLIYFGKCIFQ